MRLEGSLDALGVADLLTLLATTRKTGTLDLVDADGRRGLVHVTDGRVTGGTADVARAGLLRRVVVSTGVDADALGRAVAAVEGAEAAAAGDGVVDALRDADAVDDAALADLAREHLRDVVVDLLRWDTGDFSLRTDLPPADDLGVALAADELLEAATSRLERWRAVAATVPGDDVVLRRVEDQDGEVVLAPHEWRLLCRLDGVRRVGEVVGDDPSTALETLEALAALVGRGLVGQDVQPVAGPDTTALLLSRLETSPSGPAGPADEVPAALRARDDPETARRDAVPAPRADDEVAPPVEVDEPDDEVDVGEVALAAAEIDDVRPATSEPTPSRHERLRGARRPDHPDRPEAVEDGPDGLVTRDPAVDKGLLLRLIVGVRGL